jgi:hypothetical protein
VRHDERRQTSRRALSPKAVGTRESWDGEQDLRKATNAGAQTEDHEFTYGTAGLVISQIACTQHDYERKKADTCGARINW